jgi:hypothetical protein
LAALLASACGNDAATVVRDDAAMAARNDVAMAARNDVAPGQGASTELGPVYAMMTQVYDVDDRTVYISLSDTIDVTELSLEGAREFGGVANFAAVGGRLLVSDGYEPLITEFEIDSALQWVERRSVSFSGYPVQDNANFYSQFILDDETAYLSFESSKRVVWSPAAMEIRGVMDGSSLASARDGLTLEAGGNRNGVRYDGAVLQAFFYHDEDWFNFSPSSQVVAYDPETHEEMTVIDAPCPGLSIATLDEVGNTYFSSYDVMPTQALYGIGPKPCVVRVRPDLTLDEAWTTDFTSWTGGRYVSNFRYVGGGRAIANVFHPEELSADFSADVDPAVVDEVRDTGPAWRLWLFDLEAQAAAPVEGIDVEMGSGAQFAVLEERTFVFLPYDSYARSRIYEIGPSGVATERFDVIGDVFKWVRVR